MKNYVFLLITAAILSGCASYRLQEAQSNLRSSFARHNFSSTVALLKKYEQKNIYKDKDDVLFNLEMGTAMHFNAYYDSSSYYFSEAEQGIDALFTKSISRGLASFLFTNDNSLSYNGESYENIYLNAFKSLNYMHQNNYEDALVEARRMTYKLSRVESKYKGMAKALSKMDTLGRGNWQPGKQAINDSPLSHYLASVLYTKSGNPDDARIEYDNLLEALHHMPPAYIIKSNNKSLQKIKDPSAYNVLFVSFAGRAPVKYENDIRLYIQSEDLYLKFSLPALKMYYSHVSGVSAVIDDKVQVPLHLIERMDAVARTVYKVKEPIIYARTFVRSLVKAIGTNAAEHAVKKKDKGLGFLVNLIGKLGQELTEKADLRSWQTMPGQAYLSTVKLTPGWHQIKIEYRDENGNILYTHNRKLKIDSHKNLNIIETIYWN